MLVPPGDGDRLTRRILHLVGDDRRGEMRRAAQDQCRSIFDMPLIAPRYLELYNKASRLS
jgi:hypothetical protein